MGQAFRPAERLWKDIIMDKNFGVFKVPLVSADELRIAKQRGEDVSYEEEDRIIEAYKFNGQFYIVGPKAKGPKE